VQEAMSVSQEWTHAVQQNGMLFDYLVCASKERWGNFDTQGIQMLLVVNAPKAFQRKPVDGADRSTTRQVKTNQRG